MGCEHNNAAIEDFIMKYYSDADKVDTCVICLARRVRELEVLLLKMGEQLGWEW